MVVKSRVVKSRVVEREVVRWEMGEVGDGRGDLGEVIWER